MASYISATKLVAQLSELMKVAPDKVGLQVRSVNGGLVLGNDPRHPTHLIDFASETTRAYAQADDVAPAPSMDGAPALSHAEEPAAFRRRAAHWFDLRGNREGCISLKHLLAAGLQAIERAHPGTLEKLSRIKPRSRCIVARDPNDLFDNAHLVEQFSEKLTGDWWYGTNNSAEQTKAWLERACFCADLKWAKDFKTSLGG